MAILSTTANAPRAGMQLSFGEEYSTSLLPDAPGETVWNTTFPGNLRWLASNGEKQIYLDRDFRGADGTDAGVNPFSIANGSLTITANRTPAAELANVYNQPYTSGMINSAKNAEFKYGYIEFRADFPGGKGLWPALWLRSSDSSVQSEIDVVEFLGHLPNSLFQTVHSSDGVVHKVVRQNVSDLSAGMHTYGVDWQPDRITFYLDGKAMGSMATPASTKIPMYLIANMAVGGTWPGNPDPNTSFPAEMQIDYIRVWQDASVLAARTVTGTAAGELLSGNDGNDVVYGNGGNDTIFGANGNDQLFGGAGSDRILGGGGNDTIEGRGGTDFLAGGIGNDTYVITTSGATIYETTTGGIDTVATTFSSYSLTAMLENLVFRGTGAFRGVGNASNNAITGGAGSDTLISSGGGDRVDGGAGNDNLDAGAGNDVLIGGLGNDVLRGGDGADVFVHRSGETGADTIMDFALGQDRIDVSALGITSLSQALAGSTANTLVFGGQSVVLNNLSTTGLTASNFVFSSASTALQSGSGDGTTPLVDGPTADRFVGGPGDDLYRIDHIGDVIVEVAGGGYDTVETALSDFTLTAQLEALTYTGTETFRGVGNGGDNVMISQGGDANLIGGSGRDTLTGSAGNDRLTGGTGDDVLIGGGGFDTLAGADGSDVFVFRAEAPGRSLVTDFAAGVDMLDLRGVGATSFDDVLAHAVQDGASVVITYADHVVALQQTGLAALQASDFTF